MPTAPATPDQLHRYRTRRDFGKMPEPRELRAWSEKFGVTKAQSAKRFPRRATQPPWWNGNIG